jgi:Tfp pilus assembly protein PilF
MGKRVSSKVINFIQDGSYFFKRGQRAYYEQDLNKAKKNFERAVHFDPKQASYHCQLAAVLADLGELTRSNELLNYTLQKLDPDMAECTYLLAANYTYLGDFRRAEKCAKEYLRAHPKGEYAQELLDLLDMIYEELGTKEPSWDEEELIIKQEQANSLMENGKYYAAIDALKEMIKDHPTHWHAHNQLALAYFYSHQIDIAIETLYYVLEQNEGNIQSLCHLAVIYHYSDMKTASKDVLELLENVHPFHEEQRHKLGITFAILKKYEISYKWLYSLYRIGYEGNAMFYYWLTVSAVQLGKKQTAEKIWKWALQECEDEEKLHSMPDPFQPLKDSVLSKAEMETSSFDFGEALKHISKMKDSASFRSALAHKLYHARLNAKCQILYTIYKLNDDEAANVLQTYSDNRKEPILCRELAQLFAAKINNEAYENLNIDGHIVTSFSLLVDLEKYEDLSLEELFKTWYMIFSTVEVNNIPAWTAAVVYHIRKKTNAKSTQSSIAEECKVSVSSLRTHLKKLQHILTLVENNK